MKFEQVFWRVSYFFPKFIKPVRYHPTLSKATVPFNFLSKNGITSDYRNFIFLNESYDFQKIGWDCPLVSKLWNYNLHYFDFLLQESTKSDCIIKQKSLVSKWVNENSFGKGTGWEPYPTSIRIINWIKWDWKYSLLDEGAKISLWNQVRWLANRPEFHLLGNHLFVNAKALLFAYAYFELEEKSYVFQVAIKILNKELNEQFLEDGAHFELSPMYHSLIMEDLLDLLNISNKLPISFPKKKIEFLIQKGMRWLKTLVYYNNELPHFNDCANGIAHNYEELMQYAKFFNIVDDTEKLPLFKYYEKSGFVVYKSENWHLIADIGHVGPDYLPGHAHADTLSFEMAINGIRVIVNSGTSLYGTSSERLWQRSTLAHSTVQIDGLDSSEIWSGFRMARRARPYNIQINGSLLCDNIVKFSASHNGYQRISKSIIHSRYWDFNGENWTIIDQIQGNNKRVVSRFYLHPEVYPIKQNNKILIFTTAKCIAECSILGNVCVDIINTQYHDQFGVSKPNKCIEVNTVSPCIFEIKFKIIHHE